MKKSERSSKIFGISFFSESTTQLLNELKEHLSQGKELVTVTTPNPEQVVQSRSNPILLDHINTADYCLPDGIGIVFASQLLHAKHGQPAITERIAGVDVVSRLLAWSAHTSKVVLVVGGRDYADESRQVPQEYFELGIQKLDLSIHQLLAEETDKPTGPSRFNQRLDHWYWHEGFANVVSPKREEQEKLEQAIELLKPDLVFVAFGAPYQEQWLMENLHVLRKADTQVGMVVGGSFDILLGKIKRAPNWMRQLGLEWSYRLIQEPHRWRRQLRLLEFSKLTVQELLS